MAVCISVQDQQADAGYLQALNSVLSERDFRWLGKQREGTCLSLFVPFERSAEGGSVPSSLANLKGRVREWLMARGQSALQVRRLLEPLRQIEGDSSFWKRPGEGLAYFRSAHSYRLYRLSFRISKRISIGGHFDASPLILSRGFASRFFLLALERECARLLECSHEGFRRIQLGSRRGSKEGRPVNRFREVEHCLSELFGYQPVPLVLVADPDLASACRSASSCPGLPAPMIETDPERFSDSELHKRAWAAVEPFLARGFEAALQLIRRNCGDPLTSSVPQEILPAALAGQVRFLFAASEPAGQAAGRGPASLGDRPLIEQCALAVLSHGGKLFVVAPGTVPGGGAVAALFR